MSVKLCRQTNPLGYTSGHDRLHVEGPHPVQCRLPAWVGASYRWGWRHLAVTAADDGREAAQTGPAGEGGRTWYAESA